ncbi:MAG TPA: nuclear transport factor 2 family protein [Rariglobus sp.]
MTKWIFILASAAVLSAATPDAKTEKEVMAALENYRQGILKRDAALLTKVLSDDLAYSHSSNTHEDKAAVLAALKGTNVTEAIDFKVMKVLVYGNTATVKGDVDFRNNNNGTVAITKLNVLHVFVKGPQGWQLVARQSTRYGDPIPVGKK